MKAVFRVSLKRLKTVLDDTDGAIATEYAILAAVLAAAIVGVVQLIGLELVEMIQAGADAVGLWRL